MDSIQTRAGLQPVEAELPFNITTEDAEEYLQQRFNTLIEMMRKNGDNQSDFDITLATYKISKKFYPLILALPLDVLKNPKDKSSNDELDIFSPGQNDQFAALKDPFYKLVASYIYDKNDEKAFFSNSWRQALGVTLSMSHKLKQSRIPKINSFNKGQLECVMCFIDPIRLFHDMLTDVNNKDMRFNIEIAQIQQMKNSNFRYTVNRISKKNKKKNDRSYSDRIMYEIGKRMRSSN